MCIAIGSKIQIYLRTGLIEEGIVVRWTDEKSILRSLHSQNLLMIQNTSKDVIAVKIFIEEETENKEELKNPYVELEETPDMPRDINLRTLKLIELQKKRKQIEKKQVRELLTTHRNNGPKLLNTDNYALPRKL